MAEIKDHYNCYSEDEDIYVANDNAIKGSTVKYEESPSENQEYLLELVDEEACEKDTVYVNVESGLVSSVPSEEGEIEECSNDEEYIEERQQADYECEDSPSNDQESLSKLVNEEVIVNKENDDVDFQSGDPSKEGEIEEVSDYTEYAEERQQGDSEYEKSSLEDQESLSELIDEDKDAKDDVLSGDPLEHDESEKSFDDNECTEERQEADGEENSVINGVVEKELDFDEDMRYPQYIPKKGKFFQHDVRNKEDVKQKEEESNSDKNKKLWLDKGRWRHDRFCLVEQFPKSKEELIEIYGYDMRNKNGPPQARRQGRYGDQKKLDLDKGRWGHDQFRSEERMPKSKHELIKISGYNMQNEDGGTQTRCQKRNENWKDSTAYGRGKFRDSPQEIARSYSSRDGPREFRRGPRLQGQHCKKFNSDMSNDKEDAKESGELLINTVKEDSEVNNDISIINSKEFPALPTKETIVEQYCKKSSIDSPESKSVGTLFENSNLSRRNSQDLDIPPRRGKTVPFSNHHSDRGIRRPIARGPRGPSHRDHRSHGDHRRGRVNSSRISPTFIKNKENHLNTDFENLALHQNVGFANDVHSNAFRQLEHNDSDVNDIPINSIELPTLPSKESIPESKTFEQRPFFQKCSSGSPESKSVRTLIFENSNLSGRNSLERDIPSRGGKIPAFSNHAARGIRRPIAQRPSGTGREDRNRRDKVNVSHISPAFFENEENHPTTDLTNLAFRKTVGVVKGVHSNAFGQPENNDVDCSRHNSSELSVMALKGAGDSADRPKRYSYLHQRRLEINSDPSTQHSVPSQHSPFYENINEKTLPAKTVKDAGISADHPEQRTLPETSSYPITQQNVSTETSPSYKTEYQPTLCTPTESVSTPSIESQSTYIPPPINTCSSVYHTFQPATFNPYTENYAGYHPTLFSPTQYAIPTPGTQNQSTYISPYFNPSAYQPFIPISNPNTNSYEYQSSLYAPTEYVVPVPNAQNQSADIAASFNTSTYQSTMSNPNTNGYGYLPALNNPAASAVPNLNTQSHFVTSPPLINPSACQPFIPTAHGVYNPFEEKQVFEHAYSFMYKSSVNSF